jgi:DNA-binding MarR family transcriptional regulator
MVMNHVPKSGSKRPENQGWNGNEEASAPSNDEEGGGRLNRSPEKRVLTALRRIVHRVDLQSRWLLQQCSVTGPQLVCLHTLAEEGPLTSKGLAERVHVHPSTLVGIVDRLEEKGLLERRRDRRDRRSVSLTMTERGFGFVRQAPSPLQATLMAKLKRMKPEDQVRLASAMEEVVALMEAQEVAPTPIMGLPQYAKRKESESL